MSVEEKFAIIELCNRYAHHIDFHKSGEWAGLFVANGVLDESELGMGVHRGRDAILPMAKC